MRTNVVTSKTAKKLKEFASILPKLSVNDMIASRDYMIVLEDKKLIAWVYPAKTDDMFAVAWRDDEETDEFVDLLLRQVA